MGKNFWCSDEWKKSRNTNQVMITQFINWIKGLFSSEEEPVVLEEEVVEEIVQHCGVHLRFRKNCPDCLRAVGAM